MTTKGPATEADLGNLHSKIATVMTKALDQIEQRQENWSNADSATQDDPPEVNPALLSVMVRFLDANKITCAPEAGNSMNELEKKLAAKKQTRRQVGNVVHLEQDD